MSSKRYESDDELSRERHLSQYFYSNVYNVDGSEQGSLALEQLPPLSIGC